MSLVKNNINENVEELLGNLRKGVDNCDAALIYILAERFRCTKEIGVLKATHNLPSADLTREKHQIERLRKLATDANLDPEFAEKFLNFTIKEVLKHHEEIRE